MDRMKVSKCLFEMLTIKERHIILVHLVFCLFQYVSEVPTLVRRSWILPKRARRPVVLKLSEVSTLCRKFQQLLNQCTNG
jgi:hypothetical protein